jgi:tetratricopeptide (TPR) repeat protein
MYEYIITRFGPEAPLALMDRYAQGDSEAQAFPTVLGLDRDTFMRDFLAHAAQDLTRWGMKLPPGTPSINELLLRDAPATPSGEEQAQEPAGPTIELTDRWLTEFPEHPDVLELAINLRLSAPASRQAERLTPDLIDLLTRYAAARPSAALPHKLLAGDLTKALAAAEPSDRAPLRARLITHLEWLDAREQHTSAYALELSRLYRAQGEDPKAFAKILRAITVNPYDATLRESAAALAIEQRDLPAAEHQLLALITLEPDRPIHAQRLEALQKLTAP